jgi:hypothetical protein
MPGSALHGSTGLADDEACSVNKGRPAPPCAACGGETQEGFVSPLPSDRFHQPFPVWWNRGVLETSFLRRWITFGHRADPKPLPVRAFRCEHCGRLELYAVK